MSEFETVGSASGPASSAADDDATGCHRDDGRGFLLQGGVTGAESPMALPELGGASDGDSAEKMLLSARSETSSVQDSSRADFDELDAMPRKPEQKRHLEQPSSRQNLSTQMLQVTATVVTVNAVVTATWKRSSPLWVGGGKGGRHRLGGKGGSHRQVSCAKILRLSPLANHLTAKRLSPPSWAKAVVTAAGNHSKTKTLWILDS